MSAEGPATMPQRMADRSAVSKPGCSPMAWYIAGIWERWVTGSTGSISLARIAAASKRRVVVTLPP